MNQLQYPIGKFIYPKDFSESLLKEWIKTIYQFPTSVKNLVENQDQPLSEKDLLKTYRSDGWNLRELIHHCADSHMNAYIRLKLALTEDNPVVKPYNETLWAKLPDHSCSISYSVQILEGVHERWHSILISLSETDWLRTFQHPETLKITSIKSMTALYAWHSNHHLAHMKIALGINN